MKYKIKSSGSSLYFFRYKASVSRFGPFGDRYLSMHDGGRRGYINESKVHGINQDAEFISTRAMFKLAAINNFLDKLKEMCSTDLNQKTITKELF